MKVAIPMAIRNGVWKGENELQGPHGARIPVSQLVLSHGKTNGDVAHLSTIIRDITEQKQFEASQHFLLEASRLFSGSLETEAILRSLVALLVPVHADVCVIDLLNDDGSITYVGTYEVDIAGPHGCAVRAFPSHPLLASPFELGLIAWA